MSDLRSMSFLPANLDRRRFLGRGFGALAGLALGTRVGTAFGSVARRVRGQVHVAGRGIAGVGVSDGVQVVATGADGSFELITDAGREFVQMTVPAGYRIPTGATGTARFFERLSISGDEASVRFELEPLGRSDDDHTLLLLADPQTQTADEMAWMHEQTVADVQGTLQQLGDREAFGIADGDIMYDHLELYPEYERAVARMGVPFFQVVGNHDLDRLGTDGASTRTFCDRFGPRYYSFERGAVHYVVLDDVFWHGSGYIGYLTDELLGWLRNDLARVEAGRTVIVATHIPASGSQHVRAGKASPELGNSLINRDELYRLLEPYAAHILTGHTHENEHLFHQDIHEHVTGTVCGAWWSGPICWDGTPGGYAVYDIRGDEVTWRYKSTGHPDDHQMRVYPRGADPTAGDEIVANIWDWDPQWTVLWHENGERRGPMARRIGLDPLSVQLHSGPDLPPHRPWVDPLPTSHLFYAPASAGAREILVEATDRFGRVHIERVSLDAGGTARRDSTPARIAISSPTTSYGQSYVHSYRRASHMLGVITGAR